MWATSEAFTEALEQTNRQWRSRVDILYGGQLVQALDVLLEGSVDLDSVAVRRAGKFQLTDPSGSLTPRDAHDLLAPKGTELRPFRGLVLASGAVEWVPLGVLGISEPTISRKAGGGTVVDLTAMDRVDAVRARRFASPWAVHQGTPTHEAISAIVTSRLAVETRLTPTGSTTPALVYDALSDPWDAVRELAGADTLSAFFDPLGSLAVVRDVPVQTGIIYKPGPGSFLIENSRTITADNTYSGVVVHVEHPDRDPIHVEVWDTNPKSPTYAAGPFGYRPYGYSSPAITTPEQAVLAANTILPRVTRMRQTATIVTVGHPGHDVGDVVTVEDPDTKTSGDWVVTGGAIPVRAGKLSLKLQEV